MSRKAKNSVTLEVIQFLTLFLCLSIAAVIFQQTGDNLRRFAIICAISVLYVFWGYWHHSQRDRMLNTILLEYTLVAAIIILLSAAGLGIIRFF